MATLSDLQARLQTLMNRTDLAAADTLWALNKTKQMTTADVTTFFVRKASTFSTVAGTKNYALPSDWREPVAVWFLTGAQLFLLKHIDRLEHVTAFPDDTARGAPTAYHVFGGSTMILDKTPDQVYTINRDYLAYLPDYALATDSDSFSVDFELGLVYGAAHLLSIQLGAWDSAQRFKQLYDERKKHLFDLHVYHEETADRPLTPISRGVLP